MPFSVGLCSSSFAGFAEANHKPGRIAQPATAQHSPQTHRQLRRMNAAPTFRNGSICNGVGECVADGGFVVDDSPRRRLSDQLMRRKMISIAR